MAAPVFIAGQYTGTFNSLPVGMTEQGFDINTQIHEDPIQTDEGGQTTLDATDAGGDVIISLRAMEYGKLQAILNSIYGANDGQFQSKIGALKTTYAAALVLTPVSGLGNTQVLTATKAVLITDVQSNISRKVHTGRLTFRCFPDYSLTGTDIGRAYKWA